MENGLKFSNIKGVISLLQAEFSDHVGFQKMNHSPGHSCVSQLIETLIADLHNVASVAWQARVLCITPSHPDEHSPQDVQEEKYMSSIWTISIYTWLEDCLIMIFITNIYFEQPANRFGADMQSFSATLKMVYKWVVSDYSLGKYPILKNWTESFKIYIGNSFSDNIWVKLITLKI